MARKTSLLLPSSAELLRQFGERLRLARKRRRLSARQVAERAGMAPMTLRSLERGGSGVTMGAYLAVMQVLGIEGDIGLLAKEDALGRELQDARLSAKGKRPHLKKPSENSSQERLRNAIESPSEQLRKALKPSPAEQLRKAHEAQPKEQLRAALKSPPRKQLTNWIKEGGFADSTDLVNLLDPPQP